MASRSLGSKPATRSGTSCCSSRPARHERPRRARRFREAARGVGHHVDRRPQRDDGGDVHARGRVLLPDQAVSAVRARRAMVQSAAPLLARCAASCCARDTTCGHARRVVGDAQVQRGDRSRSPRKTSSILIQGESGTGKELVARACTTRGPRATAVRRRQLRRDPRNADRQRAVRPHQGRVHGRRRATPACSSRPTVARCSSTRSATCRSPCKRSCCACCQEGEVRARRQRATRAVDVRVIAATHATSTAPSSAARFRKDLFYRLDVVVLEIPPLRDAPRGSPAARAHFLRSSRARPQPSHVSADALDAITATLARQRARARERDPQRADRATQTAT